MARVQHVTKTYRQGGSIIRALTDVSFGIEPGEFVCVAGPSGSGKTTLLNLIGLLDTPTEGALYLDHRPAASLANREVSALRRKYCGFIFQNFHHFSYLTAFQNVEYGFEYP